MRTLTVAKTGGMIRILMMTHSKDPVDLAGHRPVRAEGRERWLASEM